MIEWTQSDTYHAANKALYIQLVEAILPVYIEAIIHDILGFGQTASLQIMDHTWDTYGIIDDEQPAEKLETIQTPW